MTSQQPQQECCEDNDWVHPQNCKTCFHYTSPKLCCFQMCRLKDVEIGLLEIVGCASYKPRSHPYTNSTEIRSIREDEDGHISWQRMNEQALAEHDAAIRNATLDEAITEIQKLIDRAYDNSCRHDAESGKENAFLLQAYCNQMNAFVEAKKVLESLRTPTINKPERKEQKANL